MTIETLTDEERMRLENSRHGVKALCIIDALVAKLAADTEEYRLCVDEVNAKYQMLLTNSRAREKELKESWDACHEQHRAAEARVSELESELKCREMMEASRD